jgi:hypothetical protein
MDGAAIFVLVATLVFVGFIVWLNIYGPREEKPKDPTTSDARREAISKSVAPIIARMKQRQKR